MLKISYFIVILMSFFFYTACNNPNSRSNTKKRDSEFIYNEMNNHFNELKSKVDSELIRHFPNLLDTNNLEVIGTPASSGDLYKLIVTNRITDTCIINKYNRECLIKYSANDSCLLTYRKITSMKKYISTRLRNCYINKFPIPDFRRSDFGDVSTTSGLSPDFIIFILESQPANNIPDKEIHNRKTLLKKWEDGFSRGVAISKERNIIMYWVIVW